MSGSTEINAFPFSVLVRLKWLIEDPTSSASAGLTAYREKSGPNDLFSVYLRFAMPDKITGFWTSARVFALADGMQERLPLPSERLIITAGKRKVALAEVVDVFNQ